MGKRKRITSAKSIKKHIAQGRGSGRLAQYNPWLHIQDVASRGLVTRIRGWKSGRVHHLLSLLELRCFYTLDWRPEVVDIREQYPLLPLEETRAIAADLGIKHPTDPRSRHPVVMTTDFVTTVFVEETDVDEALCLKYQADLDSERTLEKLEIERLYWQVRQVERKILTERDVSKVLAKNIEWVHAYRVLEDFCSLSQLAAAKVIAALIKEVSVRNRPLRRITSDTDEQLKLDPGTSLAIVRYLIATRRWHINMNDSIHLGKRLNLLTEAPLEANAR